MRFFYQNKSPFATMAAMSITSADQPPRVCRLRLKPSGTLGRGQLHHSPISGRGGRLQRAVAHNLLGPSITQRSCHFSSLQGSCCVSSLLHIYCYELQMNHERRTHAARRRSTTCWGTPSPNAPVAPSPNAPSASRSSTASCSSVLPRHASGLRPVRGTRRHERNVR